MFWKLVGAFCLPLNFQTFYAQFSSLNNKLLRLENVFSVIGRKKKKATFFPAKNCLDDDEHL